MFCDQVPFTRTSLNHDDVFILDTASKIFLFSGCNSSTQERAKALEVVQYINENKHGGNCEVAAIGWICFILLSSVVPFPSLFSVKNRCWKFDCSIATDDGKFVGDPDVGEFWSLFGGYAPIPRDSPSAVGDQPDFSAVKLFW